MKQDKKLLEVSMMLGDAIKKLDALSAYKPPKPHEVWLDCDNACNHGKVADPYAHLEEAQARGEVVQKKMPWGWSDLGFWLGSPTEATVYFIDPPDRYRIKPKTESHVKFESAYLSKDNGGIALNMSVDGKPVVFFAKGATALSVFDFKITDDEVDQIARDPSARQGYVAHFANPEFEVEV